MFSVFSSHIKTGTLEGKSKKIMLESSHLCSENVSDYLYHDVPTMSLATVNYDTLYTCYEILK